MTYLVIDTSSDFAVLALCDETQGCAVREALVFEGRRTLSQKLLPRIDAFLRMANLTPRDLSGYGVGIGPGSFTGLRVGVTTAKILAMTLDKPLYGLDTLAAYAHPISGSDVTAVATRSRRNEVYANFFPAEEAPGPAVTLSDADFAARCAATDRGGILHAVGPAEIVRSLAGAHTAISYPPAEGLAAVLAARIAAGEPDDPRNLVPAYVAPPIITTPKDSRGIPA